MGLVISLCFSLSIPFIKIISSIQFVIDFTLAVFAQMVNRLSAASLHPEYQFPAIAGAYSGSCDLVNGTALPL